MEMNPELTISIYPTISFSEKTHLFNGHEVDKFLTESVEGWKGDPESAGTMMYFNEGEEEKSRIMRGMVNQAFRDRVHQLMKMKEEMERYKD